MIPPHFRQQLTNTSPKSTGPVIESFHTINNADRGLDGIIKNNKTQSGGEPSCMVDVQLEWYIFHSTNIHVNIAINRKILRLLSKKAC